MEYNKERIEKSDGSGFYEIFIRPVPGGRFQRVTREFNYKTETSKIASSISERRKWAKFDDASNSKQHITTYGQDVFIDVNPSLQNYYYKSLDQEIYNYWDGSKIDLTQIASNQESHQGKETEDNGKSKLETELQGEKAETLEPEEVPKKLVRYPNQEVSKNKDKNNENNDKENNESNDKGNKKGMCRHCQGNHWSFACPSKGGRERNERNNRKEGRERKERYERNERHERSERYERSERHERNQRSERNQENNNSRWKSRDRPQQERPRGDYQTKTQRTIKIMNLPEDCQYKDLKQYLSYYGEIEFMKMIQDKKTKEFIGIVILTYLEIESAKMALEELHRSSYSYSILNVTQDD